MFARVRLGLGSALLAPCWPPGRLPAPPPSQSVELDASADRAAARGAAGAVGLSGQATRSPTCTPRPSRASAPGTATRHSNPQNTNVGSFTAFGEPAPAVPWSATAPQTAGARRQRHALGPLQHRRAARPRRQVARQQRQHRHATGRIEGVGKFNALAFFVIDAADVGGAFSIKVGDTLLRRPRRRRRQRLANGNIHASCGSCSTRRWTA